MDNVKVSVCIPAYQQPVYFRRTLESVLSQKFSDYEIVITDDSRDNSIRNIVDECRPNSKIKYFQNYSRKGSPGNWNEAVGHATGEYVKILHHDDWFYNKDSLLLFVKLLDNNPDADFGFCATVVCDEYQKFKHINRASNRQLAKVNKDPTYIYYGNIIGSPSATIFRRSMSLPYDTSIRWLVDVEFYIRVLRRNPVFAFDTTPLICTTDGASHQITYECNGNKAVEISEFIYLYRKHKLDRISNIRDILFCRSLFRKYGISSAADLNGIINEQDMPRVFRIALIMEKTINSVRLK